MNKEATKPTETIKRDWNEVKGKLKMRFGKLTDESVESLKGNLDLLSSKLQSVYGYAREQADKELAKFKASLETIVLPEAKPVLAGITQIKPPTHGPKKVA